MLENRISDTPFWATVKSDLPTASTSAAELSSPLLTTASVTTVITATPIANAMPIERDFFAHRFPSTKVISDMSTALIRRPSDSGSIGST